MATIRRVTLSDECYSRLKDQILSRTRKHGEKINTPQIAKEFGVSRSPVVKALERLQQEGLIEIYPNSGTYVRMPTERDIEQISEIRRGFERLSLELAFEKNLPSLVRRLEELEAKFDATTEKSKGITEKSWFVYDRAFHETIAEVAGNDRLMVVLETIRSQVELFRAYFAVDQAVKARREHQAVLACLQNSDLDGALAALNAHIESVTDDTLVGFSGK